ncbi:MAG: hypothetical protein ACRDRQ_20095 [Pseudonocardiaceae bacterium]
MIDAVQCGASYRVVTDAKVKSKRAPLRTQAVVRVPLEALLAAIGFVCAGVSLACKLVMGLAFVVMIIGVVVFLFVRTEMTATFLMLPAVVAFLAAAVCSICWAIPHHFRMWMHRYDRHIDSPVFLEP